MKRSRLLLLLALPLALELGLRVAARLLHRERGIVFHAELGWRMVPGVEKVGPFWSGSRPTLVNSRGWRDEELELERAPGRVRMVVVGDSYTFGVGVDPEQRFTEQLELLSPGLDVVNLGMNAVGPDQELLYLEQDGLPLAPALVLCALCERNDFLDVRCSRNGYWPKPYFTLERGELVQVPPRITWDVRLRQCGYLGEACYRAVQRFTPYLTEAPEWRGRDSTPLVAALLLRMRERAGEIGARFLVLLVRSRTELHPADALLPALAEAGIPVVDTLQPFVLSGREGLHLPDGHWTLAGHRLAAELIAAELSRLDWP